MAIRSLSEKLSQPGDLQKLYVSVDYIERKERQIVPDDLQKLLAVDYIEIKSDRSCYRRFVRKREAKILAGNKILVLELSRLAGRYCTKS